MSAELTKRRLNDEDIDMYRNARESIPNGKYRHYRGALYEVIGIAISSETLEPMVVYYEVADPYRIWTRPASDWYGIVEGGQKRFGHADTLV